MRSRCSPSTPTWAGGRCGSSASTRWCASGPVSGPGPEGAPSDVQAALDTTATGGVALSFTPRAPVTFAVPDTLGAVQVTAELNLDDFEGAVSLLHHVQGARTYDFFTVESGTVRQGRMSGGER